MTKSTRLREIQAVRQRPGEPRLRWFQSEEMDLYLWADATGIVAFELCYDKPARERSLRWTRGQGLAHGFVDDGELDPRRNDTPLVVLDGPPDIDAIRRRLAAVADNLDPEDLAFVTARLGAP